MTNKLTVPSELIHRAIDAIEQVGYQDKFIDYTFVRAVKQELRDALDEPTRGIDHETMRARYTDPEALDLSSGTGSTLRFVVADPVPPAGGEPEVMGTFGSHAEDSLEVFNVHIGEGQSVGMVDRAHVTRLQAEVERLNSELTLHHSRCAGAYSAVLKQNDGLQSELTKALELLADVAKTPWMYDVLGSVREYVANQSAPADKGHGEPVALPERSFVGDIRNPYRHTVLHDGYISGWNAYQDAMVKLGPLYAEQPAPVSAVMPDFDTWYVKNRGVIGTAIYKNERKVWNACLDELARLNSEPKP